MIWHKVIGSHFLSPRSQVLLSSNFSPYTSLQMVSYELLIALSTYWKTGILDTEPTSAKSYPQSMIVLIKANDHSTILEYRLIARHNDNSDSDSVSEASLVLGSYSTLYAERLSSASASSVYLDVRAIVGEDTSRGRLCCE